MSRCVDAVCAKSRGVLRTFVGTSPFCGDREKPGAERIAILGLGPGDYRGAYLLRQVETMF